MKNIHLSYKEDDFRQACIFDDVKRLELQDLKVAKQKELPVIVMNNVTDPIVQRIQLPVNSNKAILYTHSTQ